MSDLCDDADSVRRLAEGGARFGRQTAALGDKKHCKKCGVPPTVRTFGGLGHEILTCPRCMRQTAPLKSRQALWTMWNGMN